MGFWKKLGKSVSKAWDDVTDVWEEINPYSILPLDYIWDFANDYLSPDDPKKTKLPGAESLSMSPEDIQKMIDDLSRRVGSQVREQGNRVSDTLSGAPQATVASAKRGSSIKGKQAVEGAIPGLKLAGSQSKIQAEKFLLQLKQQQKNSQQGIEQQQQANIMGMFNSIGSAIGGKWGYDAVNSAPAPQNAGITFPQAEASWRNI